MDKVGSIAHIRERDGRIQSVEEHLQEVAELAARYAALLGVEHLARMAGLLHDMGKYSEAFRNYIREAVENPDHPPRRGSVDHSTAGGRLIYQRYHQASLNGNGLKREEVLAAEWIAMCIISHHGGLRDFLTPDLASEFLARVADKELPEYDSSAEALTQQVTYDELDTLFQQAAKDVRHVIETMRLHQLHPLTATLALKFVFSCLIDADRTNTRRFEEGQEESEPQAFDSNAYFKRCLHKLHTHISQLESAEDADHPINRLRQRMSMECDAFAYKRPGIYRLSIPTGGGKTLASFRYALNHAIEHGHERIIYIVPYTTIIEQNAKDIRDILQEEAQWVLEHHSNVIWDSGAESNEDDATDATGIRKKLKLARDDWDSPIIFTTMVQFLNTFYAGGTRNVRRLHRLANAVLIFDEVQSVPVKCVSLFNQALNILTVMGRSTAVLCTATQPALEFVEHKLHISGGEMIHNLQEVGQAFKRVELYDRTDATGWSTGQLTAFIQEQLDSVGSVLTILNTKSAARKLYEALESDRSLPANCRLFHLSTNMCPAHRKNILHDLKTALQRHERVVCISTQLIEAGVNISFDCVIRSLAGLDSIAQAAGRCNRHGKDPVRPVYIVKYTEERLKNLPEIKLGAEITERVLADFKGQDLLSGPAMQAYFHFYFDRLKPALDYEVKALQNRKMMELLHDNKHYADAYKNRYRQPIPLLSRQALGTSSQHFDVIDQGGRTVLVPYNEEARQLLLDLNGKLELRELSQRLRQAQQYGVQIYEHEFKKLYEEGAVYELLNGSVYALRDTAYSQEYGVDPGNAGTWEAYFT